jgi:hypothetical protein
MKQYACIKNSIVENVLLFEESDLELLQTVKESFSYDELLEYPDDLIVEIGYLYDGTYFYKEEGKKALRLDEFDPDKIVEPGTITQSPGVRPPGAGPRPESPPEE